MVAVIVTVSDLDAGLGMPKKQKQSKAIPGEEKAPGLSLADFMTVAPPRGSKKNPNSDTTGASNNFPELGQLSQTLPVVGQGSSATSSCWGSKSSLVTETVAAVRKDVVDDVKEAEDKKVEKPTGLSYTIGKTKKGSLPIRVENRNKGKKVTVIFNVTGNLKELLSELKHAAGSGGVVKDDTVEIQGDKSEFVEKFLKNKLKKK